MPRIAHRLCARSQMETCEQADGSTAAECPLTALLRHAAAHPDRPALCFLDGDELLTLSYAELAKQAVDAARGLGA